MSALILHPTASTVIPYTICKPKMPRKRPAPVVTKPRPLTNADLRALVNAAGLKATTQHTKAELQEMLITRKQVKAAAAIRAASRRRVTKSGQLELFA